MGGGLMQLVAYGAQDVYLTGNPQITFWKVTYRRHTNFAMESIEQTFNGQADFGRRVQCTISRNGDLVHKVYVTSSNVGIIRGSMIVYEAELEIGGQMINALFSRDPTDLKQAVVIPFGVVSPEFDLQAGQSVPPDPLPQVNRIPVVRLVSCLLYTSPSPRDS